MQNKIIFLKLYTLLYKNRGSIHIEQIQRKIRKVLENHSEGLKAKDTAQRIGYTKTQVNKEHVTYVPDNSTWDIWDVSNEIVGVYWSMDE